MADAPSGTLMKPIYRLLQTIVIGVLSPLRSQQVYTVRHGLAKGLKRRGGLGFLVLRGSLTAEERYLVELDLLGKTVYDVGGYEGIYTIFFARAVGPQGRVVTYEPNQLNCKKIRANIALNGFRNVELRPLGVGRKRETRQLAFSTTAPGTGSVNQDIKTELLKSGSAEVVDVEIDSLDNDIAEYELPKPDLVKIDVEGLEVDVVLGMTETLRKHRPALFIETHGIDDEAKVRNVTELTQLLSRQGYALHHVESGRTITPTNANQAMRGHLYCVAGSPAM